MTVKITSFLTTLTGKSAQIIEKLKKIPKIVKIQNITGEYDLLIELEADEPEDLAEVFSKHIDNIPGITTVHSHYIMKTWEK
jgi:DNA-binding Lrp family transcriptional regulator